MMNIIVDISSKRWLDEQEAEIYTSFGKDTLREKRDLNLLPFRREGRKIIYEKRHLDEMMEKLEYCHNGLIRTYK
jgi:hypothetical protein